MGYSGIFGCRLSGLESARVAWCRSSCRILGTSDRLEYGSGASRESKHDGNHGESAGWDAGFVIPLSTLLIASLLGAVAGLLGGAIRPAKSD